MKVTNFGPGSLPLATAGWSTGATSVNSNFNTADGGLSALNFVQAVTVDGTGPLLRPIVNVASGSNITLTIDKGPGGSTPSNTVRIHATGGGAISAGSNSMRVSEDPSAGASSTLWSPFDHRHDGIGTITSSSSNTMQRGTWNVRAGSGIALALSDSDGDGEFDTTTIVNTGTSSGGGGGTGNVSTVAATTIDYGRANLYAYGSLVSATYGDNFDTGSLDAKWNAYIGARGNWNTTDMLGWAHDASNVGALIQAVPAGNWTIECEVIPGTLAATGFQDEGLIVTSGSSSGSSTDMRWGIGQSNSFTSYRLVWEKFVNGAFSSSYTTNLNALTIPLFAPIYLRLVWGGTNFTAQWSYNRRAWYDISASAAPGFTVANFGINNNSAGGWFNYFDKVA